MLPRVVTRYLCLGLLVAFFATGFALLGAERWGGNWRGSAAGGLLGLVFGLEFAGVRGPRVDRLFPAETAEWENR